MPIAVPEGYVTLRGAYATIRERTGYGKSVADNAIAKLEESGSIHLFEHPGHKNAKLLSLEDVEKVIVSLTTVKPT